MKLFGQAAVRYKKIHNTSLQSVIAQMHPAAQAAGCISPLEGLSGGSFHFKAGNQEYVARQQLDSPMPGVSLPRQYRALARLPQGIGPRPVCLTHGWLIVEWLQGEVKSALPSMQALATLLHSLHCKPCFGWRISVLPLLKYYWQWASPERRSLYWLQWLKKMKAQGEPKPLRVTPLHMDVHAGNLVHQAEGIKLIDWEYAGDGDIALELAAAIAANSLQSEALVNTYASLSNIAVDTLRHQVYRWLPWVVMLMASWYECRWRQTKDRTFITLADETWCRLRAFD